jgi:nitrite reductase/ring-hydroxylating ferredoxin subunit
MWRPANPAKPKPGVKLCEIDEIEEPGKAFYFEEGLAFFAGVVVRQGDVVRGYLNVCPHANWQLGMQGDFLSKDRRYIICHGHAALFRVSDGKCVAGPSMTDELFPWPVEVREGAVYTV